MSTDSKNDVSTRILEIVTDYLHLHALDLDDLADLLYRERHAGAAALDMGASDVTLAEELEERLPTPTIEVDWQPVLPVGDGMLVKNRTDGIVLRVTKNHVRQDGNGNLSLCLPALRTHESPGFYVMRGATTDLGPSVGRFYLNSSPNRIVEFVHALAEHLNAERVPHLAKTAWSRRGYDRRDSTVLYVPAGYYLEVKKIVIDLIGRFPGCISGRIPDLTAWVAEGVGFAFEPIGEEGRKLSFGEHRMRVIAKFIQSQQGENIDPSALSLHLRSNKIDPNAPHRNVDLNSADI